MLLPKNELDYIQTVVENPDEYGVNWLHEKRNQMLENMVAYQKTVKILNKAIKRLERKHPNWTEEVAAQKQAALEAELARLAEAKAQKMSRTLKGKVMNVRLGDVDLPVDDMTITYKEVDKRVQDAYYKPYGETVQQP